MAGVFNKTARQFNLKALTKSGHRALVRVAPGFNSVPDDIWKHFVEDEYVLSLKKNGSISFGPEADDLELERDPDTKVKSRLDPVPGVKKVESEEDAKSSDSTKSTKK